MPNRRPSTRATLTALLAASLVLVAAGPVRPGAILGDSADASEVRRPAIALPAPAVDPDPTPAPVESTPVEPTPAPVEPTPTPAEPTPTPTDVPTPTPDPTKTPAPTATPAPSPTPSPTQKPSDALRLVRLPVIRGNITPKSVVATQTGLFFAQNMMYRHTMTVYNRKGQLIKTISDRVTLSSFGYSRWPWPVSGAPVEAAVAPNGKHMYVTQYSMYGPGSYHPGWDTGWVNDTIDRSFVYEISTSTFRKTRVFQVGPVPKAVAVSPDGRWLLAGNWTHRDVSLVSLRLGREVKRIVIGGNPRGIAFAPNSSRVYLSAESGQRILVYTFATGTLRTLIPLLPGEPRHMVIDKAGKYLYLSLNKGGAVVKIDIATRRVVDRVSTGTEPRTIVLAPDGRSLYVVNYTSQTLVKVRTRDMVVLQRFKTAGVHPVGVDYDAATKTVWVSCYRGTIERFADR